MPTINVTVKWNGQKFSDVPLDTDQPALLFKTQLFSLSGVPPDRQKLLTKGSLVKDDTDFAKLKLKENQLFSLMGSAPEDAAAILKQPDKPIAFVEDMSDEQIALALKLPAGLVNLGNTCYLNATLQCLRAMPDLHTALNFLPPSAASNSSSPLPDSLRALYSDLSKTGDSLPPFAFLQVLRMAFPLFAERNNHGYMQQDAEECWGQIVSSLRDLPGLDASLKAVDPQKKWVEQFMTLRLDSTLTCDDAPQEPASTSVETSNKLTVNIGTGVSTYLLTDIQTGLTQKIEKLSPTLDRSANYTKKSRFSRLPAYLAINFVRFQWKPEQQIRAKILKKVKFPFDLDMNTFCTSELQEKFAPARKRLKEIDDASAAIKKSKRRKADAPTTIATASTTTPAPATTEPAELQTMDVDPKPVTDGRPKEQLDYYRELGIAEELAGDVGANVSGWYELVAVLTHVGRQADSGHYIGWVRQDLAVPPGAEAEAGDKHKKEEQQQQWWKFDDDKVSQVAAEEITKLEGGGDWHSAYICLYRAKPLADVPVIDEL